MEEVSKWVLSPECGVHTDFLTELELRSGVLNVQVSKKYSGRDVK
jgi:hypothetical protein